MKPLTKAVRSARLEGREWHKQLYVFLLNYRATPHVTIGESPSKLLFNRMIKTKLPQLAPENNQSDKDLRQKDEKAKEKMKRYADKKRKAQPSKLVVRDMVPMKQKKHTKFSSKFDPVPFQVV